MKTDLTVVERCQRETEKGACIAHYAYVTHISLSAARTCTYQRMAVSVGKNVK